MDTRRRHRKSLTIRHFVAEGPRSTERRTPPSVPPRN
jgi:hypothetical protein